MTLRNANKRAKRRKHIHGILGMRIQDFIEKQLTERLAFKIRQHFGLEPMGIINGLTLSILTSDCNLESKSQQSGIPTINDHDRRFVETDFIAGNDVRKYFRYPDPESITPNLNALTTIAST